MQSTYKENLHMTPLSDWASLNVPDIFTPVVLVGDNKKTLESYNDLFYREGVLQKKVILLGKAGTGKTTFCKHLADIWCNPTSKRQFDDVDVLQQFQFLFYVSFRFAEKHETVLEMIRNQLFDDQEMQAIACHVLKHNFDSCLILMDGFDEYQRQTLAKTGKRGDITGFPSLTGVQDCILLVTSRPWKFYSLPKEDQKIFSTMELDGIKDNEELIQGILMKLEEPDPAKSCFDFKAQMKNNSMSEIMKSPLLLIFAIDIWERERSLPKSICINFIKIIESFLRRYQTKREEVITENTEVCVKKLVDKYSESAKLLPNILSNYEFVQMHAGLFLSLGHLASDFLIGQEEQSLVFQKEDCKRYNIKENDGSLKLCLDLGILTKLESTMRGIKRTDFFQFCHKTFQEFFAALWLSRKYTKEDSQEKLTLHFRIETEDDLLNHGVLMQFMCGLNPELGSDFWKHIVQENIIQYEYQTTVDLVQNLILKAVKEAHNCCDTQREQLYYCISSVRIDDDTSDEDVSLLCKMIQNSNTYLKSLEMIFQEQMCLSYSRYHSLLSSISCATNLTNLTVRNISCETNVSSDCLPVLHLHKHHELWGLELDKISISGLLLPSQEVSNLYKLYLDNLVLSHDNLVQLCSSLSSLTGLHQLGLTNISCSDDSLILGLPVLDLHRHSSIVVLPLNKISISGLLLPSQEQSQLRYLYLDNLVLSHDNLVQLCISLSSLAGLHQLKLTNISCSDNNLNLGLPVLDLHRHSSIEVLSLDKISISGLLLPSQEESKLCKLYLYNLVLSHDNLVQLCSSLSSLTGLRELTLTNISCSDNNLNLGLPVLDLHRHSWVEELLLDKISTSGLILPSQEQSQLRKLYLGSLVLSHDRSVSGLFLPCQENSNLYDLYLRNLVLSHDNLVQLCSLLSSLTDLHEMKLTNISCSDNSLNLGLPVLDLHRHSRIKVLSLNSISISGLLLPSQEESELRELYLDNLVLSHDNLVQLCSSLSSLTHLWKLKLTNIPCRDDSCSCDLSVLDLHRHDDLDELPLDKISISCLLLPIQEESRFLRLYLYNLVLSHDNLVQLCSSLSSLTDLRELKLTNISCSDDSCSCDLSVLDLHIHDGLCELSLDKISISGLMLPCQEESTPKALYMENLVLSHDDLVHFCTSLSSFYRFWTLKLTNISCSDDGGSCDLPVLDLHRYDRVRELSLGKISISGLLLPSQEESKLCKLYLDNLVLSHDNLVQLYTSLSFVITYLQMLALATLTCSDHGDSCRLLLDLHRHVNLSCLILDTISLSGVLLPNQVEPKLEFLWLDKMLLSHDNLVQLCSSISSLSELTRLQLTSLRCYDHDGSADTPLLDHPKAELGQIPDEDLLALSGLEDLQVAVMPCSEQSGMCKFTVLDLHKHHKLDFLTLDTSSISGMILPRQEWLRFNRLVLKNLVLSHYSLEQLCASLSSFSALNVKLHFTKLSCRDHGGGYCFPLLNQPDTEMNVTDTDSEMDSSDDDSDSDDSDSD